MSEASESALPTLPTLHVDGGAELALTRHALATLDGEPLARFLAPRRWFGGKGGAVGRACIADVIPLDLAPPAAVAVIEVGGAPSATPGAAPAGSSGATQRYQLPLVVRQVGSDNGASGPTAVLARVESAGGHALLFDATEDGAFRRALARAFGRAAAFTSAEGARWSLEPVADPSSEAADAADAADASALTHASEGSRVIASEQSNTSIVFADRAIFKLFRRLEAGEHPDVEIGRFLTTRTRFRNTPALLGVAHFETSDGARGVAGMLQRFVAGSQDAWSYALGEAAPYLAVQSGGKYGAGNAGNAGSAERRGGVAFADDAAALGRVTRALHDALASGVSDPAFAPQPAGASDVARWVDGAARSVASGLALLEARIDAGSLPAEVVEGARTLVGRRAEFVSLVRGTGGALQGHAGALIRHHGDYHLGQVLRAPDGTFYIIDFEGEPARPLAERRERHSALRDVAGMLRSFAYAAAVAAMQARESGPAERWEQAMRDAFLGAYLAPSGEAAGFLPDSPAAVKRLLTLFELEKVFYELAYELNNRPSWVWVPLIGIAHVLQHSSGSGQATS